ncbi:hypothetical protein AS9A_2273 [Hoyosella subflava DQS3-9A1]|uniref:Uncharacterized protein n=1 Tax=Hoyosella subflava (strain DSM 45089 / JCM 17490 / NBRC 109087 / DQS3-9A1) TaxID=443218 RepID=F6ER33_HOYSD|nr:hypothetical protein AS9A_2273 [Hoyosella subflava DQS3-9A1]
MPRSAGQIGAHRRIATEFGARPAPLLSTPRQESETNP